MLILEPLSNYTSASLELLETRTLYSMLFEGEVGETISEGVGDHKRQRKEFSVVNHLCPPDIKIMSNNAINHTIISIHRQRIFSCHLNMYRRVHHSHLCIRSRIDESVPEICDTDGIGSGVFP